ncbi:hypothetical protein [Nocardia sp. NBC_00416]|uniref:hypothetical protein n=1 Tax=Nocardia sp. NBC_00416 TaxID=2975991 RepID=UPI002E1C4955
MTGTRYRQPEGVAEFADELRMLAEAVLERVEPVLRTAAAEGQPEWSNCTWCPLCAAAALVRGEHHEVLSTVAAHGTAIVTVLREALAGVPVDPVAPHDHGPETAAAYGHPHHDSAAGPAATAAATGDTDRAQAEPTGAGSSPDETTDPTATGDAAPDGRVPSAGKTRYVGIPVNIKQ